jgi:hypothetical protein
MNARSILFPPFIKLGLPNLKRYHTVIPYHVMSYTILNFCIQEHTNIPGSGPTASAGEPRQSKTKTPSTYAVGFQSSASYNAKLGIIRNTPKGRK